VTRRQRKRHDEEIHNLYSSPNVITRIKASRTRRVKAASRMHRGNEKCIKYSGLKD
jgi:hypothetical protein